MSSNIAVKPYHTALLLAALGLISQTATARAPNVLFIAVDDLRPQLGCYGQTMMHTPNIDRLAARGTLFERAYCMVSVCGASRASLMTSIRPSRNRFVGYDCWAEKDAPGALALNDVFKQHGYTTISNGKVFHHADDHLNGWSQKPWKPTAHWYQLPQNRQLHDERNKDGRSRGPATESADVKDDDYGDGLIARQSIADLQRLAKQDQPFFLAVGFYKPHLPFVAPKKYWDLYDPAKIQLPATYHAPKGAPPQSLHTSGELRAYADIPATGPVPDDTARRLIHGYYACVSYTDAQIGRLLDELDRLQLTNDTIVVLWGDHGWNLGEHTLWCKHSCFETSLHAPLIVAAPGIAGSQRVKALTEFIDIFPSLCELAGVSPPGHLQGQSFVPLLRDPSLPGKAVAISRFVHGDSIRTDTHRFTEYSNPAGKLTGEMLYDHVHDSAEDTNLAKNPGQSARVKELREKLHTGMGKDSKPGA